MPTFLWWLSCVTTVQDAVMKLEKDDSWKPFCRSESSHSRRLNLLVFFFYLDGRIWRYCRCGPSKVAGSNRVGSWASPHHTSGPIRRCSWCDPISRYHINLWPLLQSCSLERFAGLNLFYKYSFYIVYEHILLENSSTSVVVLFNFKFPIKHTSWWTSSPVMTVQTTWAAVLDIRGVLSWRWCRRCPPPSDWSPSPGPDGSGPQQNLLSAVCLD